MHDLLATRRRRTPLLPSCTLWGASARWLAARIGQESDALKALGDFQALRREMEYLVEAIGEAAADLDGWIQMEIDRARGK